MSDSLKYSLELLVYADDAVSGEEAVLPMEVSLLSPEGRAYRDRLDIGRSNVIENNPSSAVFRKTVSSGFSPASYGKWSMTVRFLPEDIEKYSLRGVGSRLIREKV